LSLPEHSVLTPPLEAYHLHTVRPTRVEISLSAIGSNLREIRRAIPVGTGIMAIVKSNAYGHGLTDIARYLEAQSADSLGVGFLEEGIILRNVGVRIPIVVLGGVLGYQIRFFIENDLDVTVSSLELAESINDTMNGSKGKARVHLKIDTGMGRIGISPENAPALAEKIVRLPHLDLVGIYSHFATSDGSDDEYMLHQLERFETALTAIRRLGIEAEQIHIANSGALINAPQSCYTTVRPGILLYGISPSESTGTLIDVQPALRFVSKVVFIKEVPSGTHISYGRTYTTRRRTRIATIPVGYGDGYSRLLSNKSDVLINGTRYPVVGTVCMDQIMVDISDASDIHVGNDVTLIGSEGAESITAWELSRSMGTIPYELCSGISARVPRYYK
jgi:alanine racemase